MYAAYEKPVTIEEMSLELGVGAPYLENELEALVDSGVVGGQSGKYSSNVVILTGEFEKSMYSAIKTGLASDIAGIAKALRLIAVHVFIRGFNVGCHFIVRNLPDVEEAQSLRICLLDVYSI